MEIIGSYHVRYRTEELYLHSLRIVYTKYNHNSTSCCYIVAKIPSSTNIYAQRLVGVGVVPVHLPTAASGEYKLNPSLLE